MWFRAIPLPGGTRCEIGFWRAYNAPLCTSEVAFCFFATNMPNPLLRPKTKFLRGFARFRCREVPVVRSGFGVHTMHHFVLPKLRLVVSQRTCPIHFNLPNYVFGWFRSIPLPGGTRCEIGFWGANNAPLYASEVASCFFATNAQSTSLGPKLSFWVVSRDSVTGWYKL